VPHREKYLLLGVEFLRGLLDLHVELVDEVDRESRADVVDLAAKRGHAVDRGGLPTKSAISSRSSASDLSGVKVTGVRAYSRSAVRAFSVSEWTVRSRVFPGSLRAVR